MLRVGNLQRSIDFWTALGFTFNPQFTDENATAMEISNDASVMLLTEKFFSTFTKRKVADARQQTEAIMALSLDEAVPRDALEDIIERIGAHEGRAINLH